MNRTLLDIAIASRKMDQLRGAYGDGFFKSATGSSAYTISEP